MAQTILDLCCRHGFHPQIALDVTNPHAMLSLVAGGVGIAIAPTSRMALRPVGGVPAAGRQERLLDMALAWRTDNSPQLVQRFVALVRELCCRNGTTRSHGRNSAAAPAPG